MKKILFLITMMIMSVALSGCNLTKISPDAIIKVNGEEITKSQYDKAFDKVVGNSVYAQYGIDLRKNPDNFISLSIKQRLVNELIIKKLLEQEIKNRNIKVTQQDLESEYEKLIDKIGSKEKFNELLKQSQVSQNDFKAELKEEITIQKLVDTLGNVNVSDKDAEAYYKKNIKAFNYPDKVKSSHILISADPVQIKDVIIGKAENKNLSKEEIDKKVQEELDAKRKKAEAILNQLKQDPTLFAQLAKENSDDPFTANDGGDLGFLAKEQLQPEYAEAAFSQKPNTISELVTTPFGYHIIMVTDRMKAGVEPFEKVKPELKNYLEQQEKTQLLQKFIEKIKNEASIEYIDESYNLDEIDKKLKEIIQKNPSLMDSQSAAE